jgi:DNA polymerase-3 subunit beta
VLLATDEGRIKLQATDLELGITTWCGAKVETEGAVTLPAKMLSDIIGALPNDVISFDLDTAKQIMSYSCAGFKGTIAGIEADEFPIIPRVTGAAIELPADLLSNVASRVAPFANDDDTTSAVTSGVNISITGNSAIFTAVDGIAVVGRITSALTSTQEAISAIIPAKAMSEVGRICEGAVRLLVNDNSALFLANDIEVVTRLISGNFPAVDRIIPNSFDTRAVVKTSDIKAAIKLAGFYETKDSKGKALASPVKFTFGDSKLTTESTKDERGNSQASIDLEMMVGADMWIKLDSRFVSAAINACQSDLIAIELQDSKRPAVFKSVGDDSFLALIMCMSTRD